MKMRYTRTFCLFVYLFVWLFDFCHKNDLNYKLNILGLCASGNVFFNFWGVDQTKITSPIYSATILNKNWDSFNWKTKETDI